MGNQDLEALGERIRRAARSARREFLELEGTGQQTFDVIARTLERYVGGTSVHDLAERGYGTSHEVTVGPLVIRAEQSSLAVVPRIGPTLPIRIQARVQDADDGWFDVAEIRLARGRIVGRKGPIPEEDLPGHVLQAILELIESA